MIFYLLTKEIIVAKKKRYYLRDDMAHVNSQLGQMTSGADLLTRGLCLSFPPN